MESPFYAQLSEALRTGSGGGDAQQQQQLESAMQRIDRFEKLLRQNDWPLGNTIDVMQRHIEYCSWYPDDDAGCRKDPMQHAYHTLARLATYDDIRYALERMRNYSPWNGPDDFGPNPLLGIETVPMTKPVRVPKPLPVVVVTPALPKAAAQPKAAAPPKPVAPPREADAKVQIERDGFNLVYREQSLLENLNDAELQEWNNWGNDYSQAWMTLRVYLGDRANLQNLVAMARALLDSKNKVAEAIRKFQSVGKQIEQIRTEILAEQQAMRLLQRAFIDNNSENMVVDSTFWNRYRGDEHRGFWLTVYSMVLERLNSNRLSQESQVVYKQLVKNGVNDEKRTLYLRSLVLVDVNAEVLLEPGGAVFSDDFILPFAASLQYPTLSELEIIAGGAANEKRDTIPDLVRDYPELDRVIRAWLYTDKLDDFLEQSDAGLAALRELNALLGNKILDFAKGKGLLTHGDEAIPAFFALGYNLSEHERVANERWLGYWVPTANQQVLVSKIRDGWQDVFAGRKIRRSGFPPQPYSIIKSSINYTLDQEARAQLVGQLRGRKRGVYLDRIKWDANSCWLDSMMLALFGIGTAPPARRFLNGEIKEASMPRFLLNSSPNDPNPIVESSCTQVDAQAFYDLLVADIVQLQADELAPICPLGIRTLWNNCATYQVPDGTYGSPWVVLQSLREAFSLENRWQIERTMELTPLFGADGNDDVVLIERRVVPVSLGKELYAFRTAWQADYNFRNVNTAKGSVSYRVILDDSGYYLGAVIMTSGAHFTTFVRDQSSRRWIYINVAPSGKNYLHVHDELPSHAYTITPKNIHDEKPVMFLYFPL